MFEDIFPARLAHAGTYWISEHGWRDIHKDIESAVPNIRGYCWSNYWTVESRANLGSRVNRRPSYCGWTTTRFRWQSEDGFASSVFITTWCATQEHQTPIHHFFFHGWNLWLQVLPFSSWLFEGLFNDWGWQKPLTPILWNSGPRFYPKGQWQGKGCCWIAARTIGGPEAEGDSFVSFNTTKSPCEGSI